MIDNQVKIMIDKLINFFESLREAAERENRNLQAQYGYH